MPREYKNYLDLYNITEGEDKQVELLSDVLNNGNFLPKTLLYKDIDSSFKDWADDELQIVSDDGLKFPTMVLFSNQRFSEYTQSWKYTDDNDNLLLNFKTVNRENNPEYGKIQGQLYNIPGENRFYTMRKKVVLDDNGSESLLFLKMKQPTAIDLRYKLSVFTTKYDKLNEFNTIVNKKFNSRQCYIRPNGHYLPMILESISDESAYNMDDRQFYGQSYSIKVMGYIITDEDYRIEERPLKNKLSLPLMAKSNFSPSAEIEECETDSTIKIKGIFPKKCNKTTLNFVIDTDFILEKIIVSNIRNNYRITLNDKKINNTNLGIEVKDGTKIRIVAIKLTREEEGTIILSGKK